MFAWNYFTFYFKRIILNKMCFVFKQIPTTFPKDPVFTFSSMLRFPIENRDALGETQVAAYTPYPATQTCLFAISAQSPDPYSHIIKTLWKVFFFFKIGDYSNRNVGTKTGMGCSVKSTNL